jgi:hypothetical protein
MGAQQLGSRGICLQHVMAGTTQPMSDAGSSVARPQGTVLPNGPSRQRTSVPMPLA